MTPEYTEKATDQVTEKLYHITLHRVHFAMNGVRTLARERHLAERVCYLTPKKQFSATSWRKQITFQ
jgi:hypothetical protein